ncbi:probable WRKY transcription factor 35 [Neltuma alba]|uniref:probable WRKY transcription factor 35 n=1 Tax=Neltuma alba TaxID=207710 RepID=UPI0010A312B0|nr:probable WRKY transcription factor 35 [Prosopis alba]
MESYEGDLSDIVRAGTVTSSSYEHWQFYCSDPLTNFPAVMEEPIIPGRFGDPFIPNVRDPFPHHYHHIPATSNVYLDTTSNSAQVLITTTSGSMQEAAGLGISGSAATFSSGHQILEDNIRRSSGNIFSNLAQISPSADLPLSPCGSPGATIPIKALPDTSEYCSPQISSSRNPALKQRKSLAKKVVCVPAPIAANSRSSGGEAVPCDLWAWRKYGQKPIKGSPYPRGYYRCSSTKGCPARKQVERSRTEPNMLVITYTSEHNHPWPTQTNALAGYFRGHK